MSGRLGIDFGTSNTVLALWNPSTDQGEPLHIPDYGFSWRQGSELVSVIPSLIHYDSDGRIWIGEQIRQRGLLPSPRTLRWMKRYISQRSPFKVRIDDREVTPYQAGEDFLTSVLTFAAHEIDFQEEEIGLSIPVEAFEHYEEWLVGIAARAGMARFRLIDEPSAAALGYGAHIQPGNAYLIFDFGGGTMHASVVLMEAEERAVTGRRCRVLGKAGRDIGGTTLDQWLFLQILRRNDLNEMDGLVRRHSLKFLAECQRIKEELSEMESYSSDLELEGDEVRFAIDFTRSEFEEVLDQHDFYAVVNQLVRQALSAAAERGYREENIQAALMVGGGSQIPSLRRVLRQIFGRDRVYFDRPLDAVARGAAAFAAGVDFFDHIQHDYAIRYVDPAQARYAYRVIIQRGTPYPTRDPIRLTVKSTYNNQERLGIAIFELGEEPSGGQAALELVFDPSGAVRLTRATPHEQEQRTHFWMNEHNPTFLAADPPAQKGDARFEVEFAIDENKRLILTARDLLNGRLFLKDYPVVKLI